MQRSVILGPVGRAAALAAVLLASLGWARQAVAEGGGWVDRCCEPAPAFTSFVAAVSDAATDDDPCCPDGCQHCPLPCCSGTPFVKIAPVVAAQAPSNEPVVLPPLPDYPVLTYLAARDLDPPPRG